MNTDNRSLDEKAKLIIEIVIRSANLFINHLDSVKKQNLEQYEDLNKLGDGELRLIKFFTLIDFLFQTQKYFWEKLIKDEQLARQFEEKIFIAFKAKEEIDPKPYIKEIGEYIVEQGREGEVKYLGFKICRELKKENVFLMLLLNTVFNSILVSGGFFESLKLVWETEN